MKPQEKSVESIMVYVFTVLLAVMALAFVVSTVTKTIMWSVNTVVEYHRQYTVQQLISQCQSDAAASTGENWKYSDCLKNLGIYENVKQNNEKYKDKADTTGAQLL